MGINLCLSQVNPQMIVGTHIFPGSLLRPQQSEKLTARPKRMLKSLEIQGPETRTAWAADQLVDLLRDPGPLRFGGREAAVQGLEALAREFRFGISGKGAELVFQQGYFCVSTRQVNFSSRGQLEAKSSGEQRKPFLRHRRVQRK